MKTKTIIGLGLLAAAALAYGKEQPPTTDAPTTTPPILPPSGETTTGETEAGGTAVAGLKQKLREIREQQQGVKFAPYQRDILKQMLQEQLHTTSPATVAQNLFDYWNVEQNPYRMLFNSPPALLAGLIVNTPISAAAAPVSAPALPTIGQPPTTGSGNFTITWDSVPVYDSLYNDWYNIDVWTCADWQLWHYRLEQRYESTFVANQIWLDAWNNESNSCWFLGAIGCPDSSYCRIDCDFVEYLASKGLDIGNIISNTTCAVYNITMNIVGTVEDISTGLSNTGKIAQFLIPVALGYLGYKFVVGQGEKLENR